jgi:hypothetical protein
MLATIQLAEQGKGHDRGDDLGGLAQLLAVDQQIAEPFGGAHELGGHDEHPAEPQAGPERNDVGGRDCRQQNTPHHGGAGETKDAADLDDLAIDRAHRTHHAQVDGKEHADGDQDDFGGLEDAKPQDE